MKNEEAKQVADEVTKAAKTEAAEIYEKTVRYWIAHNITWPAVVLIVSNLVAVGMLVSERLNALEDIRTLKLQMAQVRPAQELAPREVVDLRLQSFELRLKNLEDSVKDTNLVIRDIQKWIIREVRDGEAKGEPKGLKP